jgi:peptidoglycan/xylan/chitin deacetylase (PgdA/CDA1 family)
LERCITIAAKDKPKPASGYTQPTSVITKSFRPGGQYILLTFSNGPHHLKTPKILSILSHYKVRATFFVYGHRAMMHPEIVKQIVKEGHELGQQGFYHTKESFPKKSMKEINESIHAARELLHNITGNHVKYFRPPHGTLTSTLNDYVSNQTMRTVLWSIDLHEMINSHSKANNKEGMLIEPDKIAKLIISKASPGDVININDNNGFSLSALPIILEGLLAANYEFLTLSEVFSFPDDSPH